MLAIDKTLDQYANILSNSNWPAERMRAIHILDGGNSWVSQRPSYAYATGGPATGQQSECDVMLNPNAGLRVC